MDEQRVDPGRSVSPCVYERCGGSAGHGPLTPLIFVHTTHGLVPRFSCFADVMLVAPSAFTHFIPRAIQACHSILLRRTFIRPFPTASWGASSCSLFLLSCIRLRDSIVPEFNFHVPFHSLSNLVPGPPLSAGMVESVVT